MTIRRLVQGMFAVLTLVAAITALVIGWAAARRRALVEIQQQRFDSYRLANQLRQSSNDLTRFARMYVATGDPRYEEIYRDILAIRGGTKARPEHFGGGYWDLLIADSKAPHASGPAVSLLELMRRAKFADAEFALLAESEAVSNYLVTAEEDAMHAVRGEFRDKDGLFTRRGPPDRVLATRLLYDSAYNAAKAAIMRPIDAFFTLVEDRTAAQFDEFARSTRAFFALIELLLLVFLALVLVSYPILRSRILVPVSVLQGHTRQVARDLDRLAGAAKDIAQGDLQQAYSVATEPIKSTRPDEIGDLSRLHDEMIGQLQSAGGSIATITAGLKRAHEISKQRFVAIFQESPNALAVSLATTGEFIEVNRALVDLIGAKSAADVIGKTSTELGIWSNAAERQALFVEGLNKGGKVEGAQLKLRRVTGEDLMVEVWATNYEAEGVRYVLSSVIDVSERLTLEDQLRQSQKMDAMGKLAGGIAHDFNNLLTVIIGFGQLTITEMAKGKGNKADVEEMVRAADRAAEMTRQLLAFSRKQVVEMRDLNLSTQLGAVEKMLRRMIGDDVTLKTALASDLGTIRADAGQMEQIVANLAVNARDAMPTGGTITMTTSNVVVDQAFAAAHAEATPGSFVRLAVTDSGTGMTKETIARIFEPFFTTKEVGKGTGLGLSTVFGIVKQSNGFIVVNSEVGRGTTFEIYFPRVEAAGASAASTKSEESVPGGRETVLVAEDSVALRDLVTRVLEGGGYTVLSAATGQDALALAEKHSGKIDLLLADVVMPGMNGRALADGLSRARPRLRVLYMSGYSDDVLGRHGALDPDIKLLAKPFTPDALALRVREVLDSAV
jgi:PAS domain S-box-containing protein